MQVVPFHDECMIDFGVSCRGEHRIDTLLWYLPARKDLEHVFLMLFQIYLESVEAK